MSAFDRIVGYEEVRLELEQICDMIKAPASYAALGARIPRGIMLTGDPGVGKTLMAECFIKESALASFTLRREKNDGAFTRSISGTFARAKLEAPAIVLLDDLDKFANGDDQHRNAAEYVAVQSCMDDARDSGVFVIATVNNEDLLPDSLKRAGRFDRVIRVDSPCFSEACAIIRHYLKDRPLAEDVDIDDISHMVGYDSCAALETILNDAAIRAGYRHSDAIGMVDMVEAVLRTQYGASGNDVKSDDRVRSAALHEAGHLTVSEALLPDSVGFASIRARGKGECDGFVHRFDPAERYTDETEIRTLLAGKVAVELYEAHTYAHGCEDDVKRAYHRISDMVGKRCFSGYGFMNVDDTWYRPVSEIEKARIEAVVQAEMERCAREVRDILIRNRAFLERVASELAEKKVLLYSDIRRLRNEIPVVTVGA